MFTQFLPQNSVILSIGIGTRHYKQTKEPCTQKYDVARKSRGRNSALPLVKEDDNAEYCNFVTNWETGLTQGGSRKEAYPTGEKDHNNNEERTEPNICITKE